MNFAALLGLLAAFSITAFAILSTSENVAIFTDLHAIVIVLGGTTTVALLSFRFDRLYAALRITAKKVFGLSKRDYLENISAIVDAAGHYRTNPKEVLPKLNPHCHPFLRDGLTYLVEHGFSYEELEDILTNALAGKQTRDDQEVKVWHTISRFPPAFGLLGATLGMIAMLQTLGEPGAQERIGPAMAIALVATFYGLVTANLILIPISENLAELSNEEQVQRNIIKEGVLLIQQKRHPLYIEEYLKSFLAPSQRGESSADQVKGQNAA